MSGTTKIEWCKGGDQMVYTRVALKGFGEKHLV
jgi:hypothetical protein